MKDAKTNLYSKTLENDSVLVSPAEKWKQIKEFPPTEYTDYFKLLYAIYQDIRGLDKIGEHSKLDLALSSMSGDSWLIERWSKLRKENPYRDLSVSENWELPKEKNFRNFEKLLHIVSNNIVDPKIQDAVKILNEILHKIIDRIISSRMVATESQNRMAEQRRIDSFDRSMKEIFRFVFGAIIMSGMLYLYFWIIRNAPVVDCTKYDCSEYQTPWPY